MAPLSGDFASLQSNVGPSSGSGMAKSNVIMFDISKNPVYKLAEGYRTLQRKLKGNWKVLSNTGDTGITFETLSQVCHKSNDLTLIENISSPECLCCPGQGKSSLRLKLII